MEHCLLPFLEEFLEEHHRVIESRLSSVSREITDSRACVREELESLYRKIVSYVLLRSGLGSPTDIKIVREATGKKCTPFPVRVWTYMNIVSYKIWWITCVEHWSFLLWSEKKNSTNKRLKFTHIPLTQCSITKTQVAPLESEYVHLLRAVCT